MKTTTLRRSKRIKESLGSQQVKKSDAKLAKTTAASNSQISESQFKYAAGNPGYLQQMAEIPLDTLHEILRHLDPMDLLTLSWANKNLNTLTMERSARYIWKESFERLYASDIPPPQCPEELNLAQYARFLFHMTCMVCNKGTGHKVSWRMRLRVCLKCLDGHLFARTNHFKHEYPTISAHYVTYYLVADMQNGTQKSFDERMTSLARRAEGETVFQAWEKRHLEDLKDLAGVGRQNAILAKLEDLGWKESEIIEMYGGGFPADLAGFWVRRKLTDADWRKIRPKILSQLKAKRKQAIEKKIRMHFPNRLQKFREKFDEWTKTQTMSSIFLPHPHDIVVVEPFGSIVFDSYGETAEFKLDDIDRLAKEWIESRNKFIFSLLPQNLQERYRTTDFLSGEPLSRLVFLRRGNRLRLRKLLEGQYFYYKRSDLQPADLKIFQMLPDPSPWNWSRELLEFGYEFTGVFGSTDHW
ncbi:hypothetical protein AGABI2DRAFT_119080 [Agaricus bisporus var. bisporus H97]|uniref:hypothetical protein n=1 Tax=Agaricus bisporus var. bisporus (strain H97 / ATCC MYA-4626 / FGSC 10389) TaxID=936046 RepID=UPI00029F7771|nr:hypothetical protein AGABI2DRAFT_119080 [Agaricus bisporus var. bisporus H97]EKV46904.1 hypothetical protein AGABI2DRAFT_119080 [Agaricus bisporus var. bisporus H97]